MATHPDEATLAAYLGNDLDADADRRIEAHLAGGCPACDPVLDRLRRGLYAPGSALVRRISRFGEPPAGGGPRPAVPGFALTAELGRGGMAVVYRATDPAGRDVALKVIPNAAFAVPWLVERFRREGELFRALSDEVRALPPPGRPAVAELYAVGETAAVMYLSMEYAAAGMLSDHLPELRREPAEAARLVAEAAEAVAWMHARRPQVLHRDLKPSNLLLQPRPGAARPGLAGLTARVSDFGLARQDGDAGLSATGAVVGTDPYLAPELLRACPVPTPATEVYALGVTLYEVLAGRRPFEGPTLPDLHAAILRGDPPRPRGVPAPLGAVCLKCLARDPRRRYPTAGELAADLRRFLRGERVSARLPGPARRSWAWTRNNPGPAAAAAAAVVALGLLWLRAEERAGRLAGDYAAAVRTAAQGGRNREVLALLDKARADGVTVTPGMTLDRFRALAGVRRTEAFRAEVLAAPLDGLEAADRGRFELWRAVVLFGVDDAAADAALSAALAGPLPSAEREYAEGLRSSTTPAAVAHLRRAVDYDPGYQPARSEACVLLLASGRFDEAAALAEQSARAFPEHPDFPVAAAVAHGAAGDVDRAAAALAPVDGMPAVSAEEAGLLRGVPPVLAAARHLLMAKTRHRPVPILELIRTKTLLDRYEATALAVADRPGADPAARLFGRLPPAHRDRLRVYVKLFGVPQWFGGPFADWPGLPAEELMRLGEAHPEGLLLLSAATTFYDRGSAGGIFPGHPEPKFEALRAAARAAERAADAAAIVPVEEIALDLAAGVYAVLSRPQNVGRRADSAAGVKAAGLIRRRLARYGDVPVSHSEMLSRAAFAAGDLPLTRGLLDEWERRSPADLGAARLRAEVELLSEAYPPAARAADRVLAKNPGDLHIWWIRALSAVRTNWPFQIATWLKNLFYRYLS